MQHNKRIGRISIDHFKIWAKEKPKFYTIYETPTHIEKMKAKNTLTLTQYLNVNSRFHISCYIFIGFESQIRRIRSFNS